MLYYPFVFFCLISSHCQIITRALFYENEKNYHEKLTIAKIQSTMHNDLFYVYVMYIVIFISYIHNAVDTQ